MPKYAPTSNFSLDPAAMVFHYGQEIFEGLKAYRGEDNQILLFRPEDNLNRMNDSALRMCMPRFSVDGVLKATEGAGLPGPGVGSRQRWRNPLPPPDHDCLGARPGAETVRGIHLFYYHEPGRCLLCRRLQPGQDLCRGHLCPGRTRRGGRSQDRRQLRRQCQGPDRSPEKRICPGPLARCG